MSQDVILGVSVDTSEANTELDTLAQKADEVLSEVMRKKRETVRQINSAVSVARQSFTLMKDMFKLFGVTLNPFGEAMASIIQTTMATVAEVAALYAATGIGAGAAAILGGAIISFNVAAEVIRLQGLEDMANKMGEIDAVMGDIIGMVSSFSGGI